MINFGVHLPSTTFCVKCIKLCHRLYKSEAAAATGYDIAAIYAFGKGTAVNFAESLLKEFPERLIDVSIGSESGVIGFTPRSPSKEGSSEGHQIKSDTKGSTISDISGKLKGSKTSKFRGVVYNPQFNAWQISMTALGY